MVSNYETILVGLTADLQRFGITGGGKLGIKN